MIKVGLLGDSIRQIGYGPLMAQELGPSYAVWQPDDNCRFARYTLRLLFDDMEPLSHCDIIQFNNGLWDLCELFGDGAFTSKEEYEETILRIAKLLKGITPHVIFATTTPVREENPYEGNTTIDEYNAFVVPKLQKMGVLINDLNGLLKDDIKGNISGEDFIHLTPKGAELAAEATAAFIRNIRVAQPKDQDKTSKLDKNGAPV